MDLEEIVDGLLGLTSGMLSYISAPVSVILYKELNNGKQFEIGYLLGTFTIISLSILSKDFMKISVILNIYSLPIAPIVYYTTKKY